MNYTGSDGPLLTIQVALGLGLAGKLPWTRILFLIPTQLIASMVAGGLVSAMFGGDISNVNTILVSGTSIAQGLFIEMFLTAQLVFVILMLAVEKSKDTFMAPIGIGLALFVAELSGKFSFFSPFAPVSCVLLFPPPPPHHPPHILLPCPAADIYSQVSISPVALSTQPAALAVLSQVELSQPTIGYTGWAQPSERHWRPCITASSNGHTMKRQTQGKTALGRMLKKGSLEVQSSSVPHF